VYLEIDGLALPVLQRAMRDGHAPNLARWLEEGTHRLVEWETDLSSQTGASQAGILLGSNEDIPAFRWVEKETGRLMTCSAPADCAEIEARHASGRGLLVDGGASRGNLLSGEADEVILTVSRMQAEKQANPGYRPFLANGFNVTRALVLFGWEVILELLAATRQRRRDIRPRGHRGGYYPFLRAALCVVVRDLIVFGVLTDMMSAARLRRSQATARSPITRGSSAATQWRPSTRSTSTGGSRARVATQALKLVAAPTGQARRHLQAAQRLQPRRARRALAETGTVLDSPEPDENAPPSVRRSTRQPVAPPPRQGSRTSQRPRGGRSWLGNLGLIYLMEGPALDVRGDRAAPSPPARRAA
jgi:hypothetical protein